MDLLPFLLRYRAIYVDKKSNEKIRGQAQGFLVLATYGVELLIGAQMPNAFNGMLDQHCINA